MDQELYDEFGNYIGGNEEEEEEELEELEEEKAGNPELLLSFCRQQMHEQEEQEQELNVESIQAVHQIVLMIWELLSGIYQKITYMFAELIFACSITPYIL